MVAQTIERRFETTAHLTVRVPHGADGDMTTGARTVLRRLDALDGVEIDGVTGITPGLNALEVDVEVSATLVVTEAVDDDAARATLEDGTGVEAVHDVAVEPAASA